MRGQSYPILPAPFPKTPGDTSRRNLGKFPRSSSLPELFPKSHRNSPPEFSRSSSRNSPRNSPETLPETLPKLYPSPPPSLCILKGNKFRKSFGGVSGEFRGEFRGELRGEFRGEFGGGVSPGAPNRCLQTAFLRLVAFAFGNPRRLL